MEQRRKSLQALQVIHLKEEVAETVVAMRLQALQVAMLLVLLAEATTCAYHSPYHGLSAHQ